MELADVYSKQVKSSAITNLSFGSHAPTFERDPNVRALERSVFEQLRSILPVETTQTVDLPKAPTVNHVSFEDALKELVTVNK